MDLIANEMLKGAGQCILDPLTKLFNLILTSGCFPEQWAIGRIVSIHKKGDALDPANYRGITITSCLGKLFTNILNFRLCKFLEDNSLIREEQIGFRKGHRTTDHMFILKCIMDKYKKKRKQLYMCFIDFKKAYDSVWHAGML